MNSPLNSAGSANVGPYPTGLDGWNDAKYRLSDNGKFVTCWNGHNMVKCKYIASDDKWLDWQDKDVTVYMWTNWD